MTTSDDEHFGTERVGELVPGDPATSLEHEVGEGENGMAGQLVVPDIDAQPELATSSTGSVTLRTALGH